MQTYHTNPCSDQHIEEGQGSALDPLGPEAPLTLRGLSLLLGEAIKCVGFFGFAAPPTTLYERGSGASGPSGSRAEPWPSCESRLLRGLVSIVILRACDWGFPVGAVGSEAGTWRPSVR